MKLRDHGHRDQVWQIVKLGRYRHGVDSATVVKVPPILGSENKHPTTLAVHFCIPVPTHVQGDAPEGEAKT